MPNSKIDLYVNIQKIIKGMQGILQTLSTTGVSIKILLESKNKKIYRSAWGHCVIFCFR